MNAKPWVCSGPLAARGLAEFNVNLMSAPWEKHAFRIAVDEVKFARVHTCYDLVRRCRTHVHICTDACAGDGASFLKLKYDYRGRLSMM